MYALQRGAELQVTLLGCIKHFDGEQSLERLDVKGQGKIM
jgi:hypothetical protein